MIYLLVALAAFFNAVMDSMEHHSEYWPNTPFWNTRHPENDKVKHLNIKFKIPWLKKFGKK